MSKELLENSAGLGVLNNFGTRTVNSAFGGQQCDEVIRYLSIEFKAPVSGDAAGAGGMHSAAWAKTGLDYVIPSGSIFLSANVIVETAFNTLTALTIGTYLASNGTTVVDASGLVAAAGSPLTAIDAVGDRLVGSGSHLVTGTAGLGALAAASVIRVLYTGTVPTLGKARLIVAYVVPTA